MDMQEFEYRRDSVLRNSQLSDLERTVIAMRMYPGKQRTLQEIMEATGASEERVRRAEQRVFMKMRHPCHTMPAGKPALRVVPPLPETD